MFSCTGRRGSTDRRCNKRHPCPIRRASLFGFPTINTAHTRPRSVAMQEKLLFGQYEGGKRQKTRDLSRTSPVGERITEQGSEICVWLDRRTPQVSLLLSRERGSRDWVQPTFVTSQRRFSTIRSPSLGETYRAPALPPRQSNVPLQVHGAMPDRAQDWASQAD
jgi:hypothetical protein